jgi:hypothetical protein
MSPETKASQPGIPILKYQGSLCVIVADGCEQRACEERQFNSHRSILWSPKLKSKQN